MPRSVKFSHITFLRIGFDEIFLVRKYGVFADFPPAEPRAKRGNVAAMENLVDGAAGTNITRSEPDMNITFDFGSDFRVRADSFAIQPADGFPARYKG